MGFPSYEKSIGGETPPFQPYQIVCLQHETTCLYAEVIQIVERRHRCWVRPLVLVRRSVEALNQEATLWEQSECYDLRQDSDLLLPLALFRVALDTEVLPCLTNFCANDRTTSEQDHSRQDGHVPFRQFIQQIWQAHPKVFQNVPNLKQT